MLGVGLSSWVWPPCSVDHMRGREKWAEMGLEYLETGRGCGWKQGCPVEYMVGRAEWGCCAWLVGDRIGCGLFPGCILGCKDSPLLEKLPPYHGQSLLPDKQIVLEYQITLLFTSISLSSASNSSGVRQGSGK